MMITEKRVRIGGWAAILGGVCWIFKGGMILLTGEQPALFFEIAPAFFAVAIIGLVGLLNGRGGQLALVGMVLAVVGGVAALLNSVRELMLVLTGEAFAEIELISALAGFGWLLGLLLVGIPVWQTHALPGKWRMIPLLLAVSSFPLLIVFSILAEVLDLAPDLAERMIEIPLVLIGLIWVGLGRVMVSIPASVAT